MKTFQTLLAIQALFAAAHPGHQDETHSCTDRQIAAAGECFDCPSWTRAQGDHSYCGADGCNDASILLESGECQKCEDGTKPDPIFKTKCIASTVVQTEQACNERQIDFKTRDGKTSCEDCPKFTRAQEYSGNWYCGADFCEYNQITELDGTCSDCPSGQTPNAERTACKPIPTGLIEDYVQEEYPEESDPEGEQPEDEILDQDILEGVEFPQEDEFSEEEAQPEAQPEDIDEILIPDDIDYTGSVPMPEAVPQDPQSQMPNILLSGMCDELEIQGPNGDCLMCYPYTRPQNGGQYCDSDPCSNGIVQFDGTCTKYRDLYLP